MGMSEHYMLLQHWEKHKILNSIKKPEGCKSCGSLKLEPKHYFCKECQERKIHERIAGGYK